jgi:hypothetical protein
MNSRLTLSLRVLALGLLLPGGMDAARVMSDLQPPQKRQAAVVTAERLARRSTPPELPADLSSPFNPPDFDKPEGGDAPAPTSQVAREAAPPPPPVPMGDRQILEALAAQLTPTGTMQIGDSSRLVMGSKRFEVGTRFIVTYNNQDYELELVAIDRTTFTLRYRGEEITRPIKSVR